MSFPYFLRNGEIVTKEEATIPLENIEYQYGFGVYETIKVRNGIVFFVEQHLERLLQSAEIIHLDHPFDKKTLDTYIRLVRNTTQAESYNVKMLLIGGQTARDAQIFILPLAPLFPQRKFYMNGVKTITVAYERFFPHAKTLNMLPSYLAYRNAKKCGCYDALFTTKHGNILEGTRTNFFTIKGKTVFTPEKKYILNGVTMQTVLSVAKREGFTIEEWDISVSQLKEYDGAFLTSTSAKIMPVKQIDEFVFPGIPSQIKELMDWYDSFLKNSQGIF